MRQNQHLGAALALVSLLGVASAQDGALPPHPQTFPPGAVVLSAQAIASALSEQVFHAKLANGLQLRYQFKGDYLFVNTSRGTRSTARWKAQDGQVCIESQQTPSGCSEIRQEGEQIWVRRATTGEVMHLVKD